MDRASAIFVAMLLLLSSSAIPAGTGTAEALPHANLGLGYSATSIVPVSQAIPVYTRGDQLWIESFYGSPVVAQLVPPGGGTTASTRYLYPDSTTMMYAFGSNVSLGGWSIQVLGVALAPVVVQLVSAKQLNASATGVSLLGNTARYTFSVAQEGTTSLQGCLLGESVDTVTVGLPPTVSPGALGIRREGGSLSVSRNGSVYAPFEYSFEFFQDYTYQITGSNGTDTVNQEVGYSQPVVVTAPASAPENVSVSWFAPPRDGELDLRTVVSYSSGDQVSDSRVLFTGEGMISLGSCSPTYSIYSDRFNMTSDLSLPPSEWPRELLLTYTSEGLGSYTLYPLPWEVGRAEVGAGQNLSSSASITLGTVPPTAVASVYGREVFYVGPPGAFPASEQVTLTLLGRSTTLNATFEPFASDTLAAPLGDLKVRVTAGGESLSNSTVTVSGPSGEITESARSGSAVFALLPGAYQYSASLPGRSAGGNATVVAGGTTQVAADLSPSGTDVQLIVIIGVALVGVAVDALVWVVLPKRVR